MIRAIAITIVLAGCAAAGNGAGGDAAKQDSAPERFFDAQKVTNDSSVPHDSSMPLPDAFVPHDAAVMPDAQQGGGLCTGNNECIPSQCCWIAVCVDGTQLGALCFPS